MIEIKVEEEELTRIDKYLQDKTDYTRSKIQKLIDNNNILVNNKEVKASYKVNQGDIITIDDNYQEDTDIKPQDLNLDIYYEDDDLLIVNKESGMVVHPAPGNYSGTLVNALMGKFKLSNKDNIRPGIVHRIDKDTSGLLVVAKNDEIHDKLSEMIKSVLKRDKINNSFGLYRTVFNWIVVNPEECINLKLEAAIEYCNLDLHYSLDDGYMKMKLCNRAIAPNKKYMDNIKKIIVFVIKF